MRCESKFMAFFVGLVMMGTAGADGQYHPQGGSDCRYDLQPAISFVEFPSASVNLGNPAPPPTPIVVKGKLTVPVEWQHQKKCFVPKHSGAAIVILHGSAGVDARGDFYARALSAAGLTTLEIDMWEARGVTDLTNRPQLPIVTYPDPFAALTFLIRSGFDSRRIGVMGFSWGGVLTMASATSNIASAFGGGGDGPRFKAHLAHYPVCYAYNNARIPGSAFGSHAGNPLTGAPILLQTGEKDDYDEGSAPCFALQTSLNPEEERLLKVVVYDGASHAWDRLQIPITAEDPFAHLGRGGKINIVPSVNQAYEARDKAVRFFLRNL